jgi:hypothetical protein
MIIAWILKIIHPIYFPIADLDHKQKHCLCLIILFIYISTVLRIIAWKPWLTGQWWKQLAAQRGLAINWILVSIQLSHDMRLSISINNLTNKHTKVRLLFLWNCSIFSNLTFQPLMAVGDELPKKIQWDIGDILLLNYQKCSKAHHPQLSWALQLRCLAQTTSIRLRFLK